MKKALLATSAIVAAGFVAADAAAVDVELYGQVNKGVMMFDDSEEVEFNVVDNDMSSTRFGIKGSQVLDNGLTASVLLELEAENNASNGITQNQGTGVNNNSGTPNTNTATISTRHARVGLAGNFGAVFMGQASAATDSVTEQDLAGAQDVMGSLSADALGGGLVFRDNTGAFQTETIGAAADNMDGGRGNAVRYDTPVFAGVQGRISATQGGDIQAAAYYNGKYDAFAVKAGLGYETDSADAGQAADQHDGQVAGSVSVKHDSGLALTVAGGKRFLNAQSANVDEPMFYYVKAGYAWDAFEVAADYAKHEGVSLGGADEELTTMAVAGQYNMGNGVSLAGYARNFAYDDNTATDFEDITVYGVNMRVKF